MATQKYDIMISGTSYSFVVNENEYKPIFGINDVNNANIIEI